MSIQADYRIELRGLTKTFPGVLANDKVSLKIKSGQIHALLGENGAGKSTLVKMIYGLMQADEGQILWEGQEVEMANPKAARSMGVGMVFQHFSLFEAMTVLENIALGMDANISQANLESKIREVMKTYGVRLDPHRIVSTLSVGERQRIEIVRALLLRPKLLIMDEPTSVLTPQEVNKLFGTLRQLSATGCSILYISHKLHEIKELCDEATILRGGKVVGICDPRDETYKSMAEMMIGENLKQVSKVTTQEFGEEKYTVKDLCQAGEGDFGVALSDISFHVRSGEIFGIAGVAGNGQNELLLALSGELTASDKNTVLLDGKPIGHLGSLQRRDLGLCTVPEERHGHAAVVDFSLSENVVLTARNRMHLMNKGLISEKNAGAFAKDIISSFNVKTTGPKSSAGALSGGNLQKFIVGREILQKPNVLIVSQPTWGVDAGAAAAIRQALVDLAKDGAAIILISQDLDELLSICDEMAVINEGRLSETLNVADVSVDQIGLLMGGVHGGQASGHKVARDQEAEGAYAH